MKGASDGRTSLAAVNSRGGPMEVLYGAIRDVTRYRSTAAPLSAER